MLLSVVIPAYGRPTELNHALEVFIAQIDGLLDQEVEIIVCDDASPNDTLGFARMSSEEYTFIKYRRYVKNIGLEKNLIECTKYAAGEFLWIFGDDDFLETDSALDEIVAQLKKNRWDMLVLNRTRRSFDLNKVISENWMNLDGPDKEYKGLTEFCLEFGFISVIGFISVNIFRRKPFLEVDITPYFGTMYPHLGAMVEAFSHKPVKLLAKPLVCHRTQTAEEKRQALGGKASEADFMADASRRNALYFSHPFIKMLENLIDRGAFEARDIVAITENTVINGDLVDFLINCVSESLRYSDRFSIDRWEASRKFFDGLDLSENQRERVKHVYNTLENINRGPKSLTISVITPSYNQGEFLSDCLRSVESQTVQPIEHLVFDPGSKDDSRAIAKSFKHVTLIEEPDEGQSDALNKGFRRVQGDIIAWVNSDDQFADDMVFEKIVQRFSQPDQPDIVYGAGIYIDEKGKYLRDVYVNREPDTLSWRFQQEDGILQPALFMKRSVVERIGELSVSRHFSMDYEYWIRCMKAGLKFAYVDEVFAVARYHIDNKTYGQRGNSYAEVCDMMMSQFRYVNHNWLKRFAEYLVDGHDGVLANSHNKGVSDEKTLQEEYIRLLTEFNGSEEVYGYLKSNRMEKGMGDTFEEMKRLGVRPSAATPTNSKHFLPKISVVTPNYNTAEFIEETIRSVLDQGYPNLEYVIVDGASTDGSQKIIAKYQDQLHAYISEKDEGHADALNKGFAVTSGEIMCWINSDDVLLPGSLLSIAEFFMKFKDTEWVTGCPNVIEVDGSCTRHSLRNWSRLRFLCGDYRWIQQESTFWRRSLWERTGGYLDNNYQLAVDFELWVRFFREAELHTYNKQLGAFRRREGQRSVSQLSEYEDEALSILKNEADSLDQDYRRIFQAVLPQLERPLERQEIDERARHFEICDVTVVQPEDVNSALTSSSAASTDHSNLSIEERLNLPDDFSKLKGIYKGKRCFIVGNGPSLNKMDLSKLEGEFIFGCNSIFLLFDRVNWRPNFYTCVDKRVLPDRANDIDKMLADNPEILSFFPNEICDHIDTTIRYPTKTIIPPSKNRRYFRERRNSLDNLPESMFSSDINEYVVQPFTVTVTMLQLAAYMGFSELYLIGCDTNYSVPENAKKEGLKADGTIGLALTSMTDDDPNHFDPRYFGAGRKWHDPQTQNMIMHYEHSKTALENLGVKAYNATVGGKLEVFQRVEFNSIIETNFPVCTERSRSECADVDETNVVHQLLRGRRGSNHTMLDVGAHVGSSAAFFERLGWQIYCYEPDAKNRAKLIERFEGVKHVSIDPRAVSERPAKGVSFFTSYESTGISGLSAFRDTHKESAKVDLTSVTEIVKEQHIDHIDFLKIDVEGFDFSVLKGIPWNKVKPDVVECEFEDAKTVPMGHTWNDIAKYLKNHGYAVYVSEWHPIIRYGIQHDWRRIFRYENAEPTENAWGNLLAFRDDPGYTLVCQAFEHCVNLRADKQKEKPKQANAKAQPGELKVKKSSNMTMSQSGPSVKRPFYATFGDYLSQRSPRIFALAQYLRRSISGLWRRKLWVLPILLTVAAVFVWGGTSSDELSRYGAWAIAAMSLLSFAIFYLGFRVSQFVRGLSAEIDQVRKQLRISNQELSKRKNRISSLKTELEKTRQEQRTELGKARQEQKTELEKARQELKKSLSLFGGNLDVLERSTVKLDTDINALTKKVMHAETYSNYSNLPGVRVHNRFFSDEDLEFLKTNWLTRLGLTLSDREVRYIAHRICLEEERCDGRMATTVNAAILRVLALQSLNLQQANVIEIGTLFGIGGASLYTSGRRAGCHVNLTLIDPLDGYYNVSPKDTQTGVFVNRDTLVQNLAGLGVKDKDYRIIQKLSSDPKALKEASDRLYDYILIDGDHSLNGVSTDFELYSPLVKPGGLLVIDDYDTTDWPEIKPYVDEHVKTHSDWFWIGGDWRTAILKRRH